MKINKPKIAIVGPIALFVLIVAVGLAFVNIGIVAKLCGETFQHTLNIIALYTVFGWIVNMLLHPVTNRIKLLMSEDK